MVSWLVLYLLITAANCVLIDFYLVTDLPVSFPIFVKSPDQFFFLVHLVIIFLVDP